MKLSAHLLALATLSLGACQNKTDSLAALPPWSCDEQGRRPNIDDEPCGGNERFIQGRCEPARCDAEGDGWTPGCCPGTLCIADGTCKVPPSRFDLCTTDADCATAGQHCFDRPRISTEGKTCGFLPIDPVAGCPHGTQPFNDRCIAGLPCGGACPADQVCNIDTNKCEQAPIAPPGVNNDCNITCDATAVLVYSDPDGMLFDQCCSVSCACETLPNLAAGTWGRFSDIAIDDGVVFASAYDSTYGDLVVGEFSSQDFSLLGIQYIDGIPATGTVVGNPSGPRGGFIEAGPDVGTHTSIAIHNGAPYVTYYDVEAKALKFARYNTATQAYDVSLIDDGRDGSGVDNGDVGRYSSLVVDNEGIAHVTYYAHRIERGGTLSSGPIYARANTSTPSGFDSWSHTFVERVRSCDGACADNQACVETPGGPVCRALATCASECDCDETCVNDGGAVCRTTLPNRLAEPCDAACASGESCVADPLASGGSSCAADTTGCAACAGGEICVDIAGTPTCKVATPYSTFEDYPNGVGLFTTLAMDGSTPIVTYYDHVRGMLRGAVANFAATGTPTDFTNFPLACPGDAESVGMSASLAVGAQDVVVAFQADSSSLWYCSGSDLLACRDNVQLLDDGLRSGVQGTGAHLVGAYASVALSDAGDVYIAYQDQTSNDLLLGYFDTNSPDIWTFTTLAENGAYGAFARLLLDNGRAVVSTYQRQQGADDADLSQLAFFDQVLQALP